MYCYSKLYWFSEYQSKIEKSSQPCYAENRPFSLFSFQVDKHGEEKQSMKVTLYQLLNYLKKN